MNSFNSAVGFLVDTLCVDRERQLHRFTTPSQKHHVDNFHAQVIEVWGRKLDAAETDRNAFTLEGPEARVH